LATGQLESRSSKDMTKFIKILYLNEKWTNSLVN
jgi:hypothetical protein